MHREWSDTSEEFEKLVTDYQEDFSEEGVAEKTEAVQAMATQSMHMSAFSVGLAATGGYGPVSVTATAGYTAIEAGQESQQLSRDHSAALTRKASSRAKKEHKISFRAAASSGTEDTAAKRITNPTDKPVRVDYYQLLRKWQVDLHRYGIRLTYDLTIPEPGADILSRVREAREINAALQHGFGGSDAGAGVPEWARFDLTPSAITRASYAADAARYGAAVPPPPPASLYFETVGHREWQTQDMAKNAEVTTFEVVVPDDYRVTAVVDRGVGMAFDKDKSVFTWKEHNPKSRLMGRSGKFQYLVESWYLTSFAIRVRIAAELRSEVFEAWQLKAWSLLRDAAETRYALRRQALRERLSALAEEMGSQDPLSLRKLEREEVMKGVLAWLFGPDFAFVPKGIPDKLTGNGGAVLSALVWSKVLDQGQIIQFLHHAIEWENMAYVLYPYFWSHASRWDMKKDLDHPDFQHRAFLKAGASRVVLTIRPGFEQSFLSFIETGTFDGLPPDDAYMTLAAELQAFASTTYPGIPPANAEGQNQPEQGQRIGTWFEYTTAPWLPTAWTSRCPPAPVQNRRGRSSSPRASTSSVAPWW